MFNLSDKCMYIGLYTANQLERMKENMLWIGLFMLSGGLAALLNDIVMQQQTRWAWALAAFLISTAGVVLVAISLGRVKLKDAYFSITPVRISYRLNLYGSEHMIYWRQVASVQLSDRYILFDMYNGSQVLLSLSALPSHNTASHVAVNVQKAALEHNVTVNGINFNTPKAAGTS